MMMWVGDLRSNQRRLDRVVKALDDVHNSAHRQKDQQTFPNPLIFARCKRQCAYVYGIEADGPLPIPRRVMANLTWHSHIIIH